MMEPDTFVCSACGRSIPEGESMWTVNIHEEVLQGNEITVLDAATHLVYGRECQSAFDFPNVSVPWIGPED